MKSKRTYMIAVTKKVRSTVYVELLANSSKEALKAAKRIKFNTQDWNQAFQNEAYIAADDYLPVEIVSAGRASQYHAPGNCSQCLRAKGVKK